MELVHRFLVWPDGKAGLVPLCLEPDPFGQAIGIPAGSIYPIFNEKGSPAKGCLL
jgi:hypothetical protein